MADSRGESVLTEARLRELYSSRLTTRRPDRQGCPAPEALQSLVRREGAEEERLRTLDHAMACTECRAEYDLLRTVERAGAELAARDRSSRRSWWVPAALAASLMLAVGIGRLALAPGSGDDIVRSGPDASAVTLLAPGAQAAAGAPLRFTWAPVPGATRYRLEVLAASGDVALEAETSDTAIAPSASRQLAPGEYQWWVSALGATSRRSVLRRLEITR